MGNNDLLGMRADKLEAIGCFGSGRIGYWHKGADMVKEVDLVPDTIARLRGEVAEIEGILRGRSVRFA